MNDKENCPVYNKETRELDFNPDERNLIDNLMKELPSIKYQNLIADHINSSADKNKAIKRLDEIITFFFEERYSSGQQMLRPMGKQKLNLLFEILEKQKKTETKTETKTDKLKAELGKYGFFELPKVKQLSEPNKQSLIELISTNDLPYSIAMFDFLDFIEHIENQHVETKAELNKEVSKWFNSDKEGRSVKGNISTLSKNSKEDKKKYTAHTHKETVKIDYQKLK
jgi:hypothetical protein